MDDRSFFSGSFIFELFKPFIFSYGNNVPDPQLEQEMDELPDSASTYSPRDSLLKPNREKKKSETSNDDKNDDCDHSEEEAFNSDRNNDNFPSDFFHHNFHDGSFKSLFDMMDQMLGRARHFHSGLFEGNFDFPNFPNFPDSPSLDSKPFEQDKKDTDFDDSNGKEITSLLKESPSYQYKSPPPTSSSSRFHSTSIVRIRRPDGVIEETRKYRDSDGREEVEVITRQPEGEGEGEQQSSDTSPDNRFSNFFKRFPPFRIF